MKKAMGILTLLAAFAYAQSFYSENVTAGSTTTAVPTLSNFNATRQVRITVTAADNAVYVRYAPDLLPDGDFEDSVINESASTPGTPQVNPNVWVLQGGQGYRDAWDDSDNLLTWGWTENTVTIEEETTSEIYGLSSLRFESSGVAQLIANEDFELLTGDDFNSWTENVNAGTGTITSIETGMYDGLEAAELTGGSAHVDLTGANTTVAASTSYVLSVWGDITAAGDLLDIRIREATGGTDYLQANGTWSAAEADFCNATFDDGANGTYTHCLIEFTTDTGITALTISANVDVSADVGRVDGFSLHVDDNTVNVQATSQIRINDTTADSYVCQFTQDAAATSSARAEYAIVDPTDSDTGTNGIQPYWYTGSAWSTTETWLSSAYAATATAQRGYFEARVNTGHPVQLRIRPETLGENEDLFVDKAFCVATARAGIGILFDDILSEIVETRGSGRFTVVDDGSGTIVNFAAIQ